MDPLFIVIFAGIATLVLLGLAITGIVQLSGMKRGLVDLREQLIHDLDRLRRELPDAGVIGALRQSSDGVSGALAAHARGLEAQTRVVAAFPKQVSAEVQSGLQPVAENLRSLSEGLDQRLRDLAGAIAETHGHLVQALMTVDSAGGLSEWTSSFREAVAPLQMATASLERHFQVADDLLGTATRLAADVAGVRESAQQSFTRISDAVEHWESIQVAGMRMLQEEVSQRLGKLEQVIVSVSEGVTVIERAHQDLLGRADQTQEVVLAAAGEMGRLIAEARDLVNLQKNVQAGQLGLVEDLRRHHTAVEGHVLRFTAEIDAMVQSMAGFRTEHSDLLARMGRQREEMAQWQQRVQKEQEAMVKGAAEQLRRQLDDLPARQGQLIGNVLIGLQTLVLLALGLYVYLHV